MEAALKGAAEIGFTIVSISFSLVAVFIPLLLMGGIVGRLFREFAMTITIGGAAVGLYLADADADDVLTLPAAPYRQAWLGVSGHRRLFRRLAERISPNAGYRPEVPFRHPDGVPGDRVDRPSTCMSSFRKGFFPAQDTGVVFGITEGAQDHLVQRDDRDAEEAGAPSSPLTRTPPPMARRWVPASADRPATTGVCSSR